MTDQEIADALIAARIIRYWNNDPKRGYHIEGQWDIPWGYSAYEVVNEWRIAGACLAEMEGTLPADKFHAIIVGLIERAEMGDPRAICEAFVKAMKDEAHGDCDCSACCPN